VTAGLQVELGINIAMYELCVCVCVCTYLWIFSYGATAPSGPRTPRYRGFTITHTHTHTHHSNGLIWTSDQPVEATSTRRQTTLARKIYSRFEPAIPTSERPQTHALDRVDTGIDLYVLKYVRMTTLCVCMYKRMGALCMHLRIYAITYVFGC
jgi:hypothetical protein